MLKTKILYVITKATWGGAQRYVYDLATNLPEEFEPTVVYGAEGKLAHDLAAAGIATRELTSLGRDIALVSDIRSFFEVLRTIREVKPDIVHLNSSKAAALGALAARVAGVAKIIFTVHGWPFKENRSALARAFIYSASWFTALLSHQVIVVSKADKELARRMWGVGKKTHYIPLGLAPFETLPPAEAFRAMFGTLKPAALESSTLRLVTIGELTKNKGLRYAIAAVAALFERGIDAVYVVAGEGEERGALEAHAKRLGVDDRVFFPGFIAHASRNLSGFDVFVLPSVKEGMPYVLLEAAKAGLPIVATDVVKSEASSIQNIHFVSAHSGQELADEVEKLVNNLPAKKPAMVGSFTDMLQKTTLLYQ